MNSGINEFETCKTNKRTSWQTIKKWGDGAQIVTFASVQIFNKFISFNAIEILLIFIYTDPY